MSKFIRIGPKGYSAPKEYEKYAASIYNMPLRPRDTVVATYQRSGTTMTQELVWLIAKDFDFETAKSTLLTQRYQFVEMPMFIDDEAKKVVEKQFTGEKAEEMFKIFEMLPVEILAKTPDPRFIKTHVPLSLLPPNLLDTTKVVYVARDPRDVAVSSYHHAKLFVPIGLYSDFKQFWNMFINGLFTFTPYFEHIKEAWEKRHHPNLLFLFYEDLKKDLPSNIRRIAKFLGKEPSEEQILGLCDHMKIDNFKNNKAVNFEDMRVCGLLAEGERFIRQGKSGGWRDYFDEEMTKQAESWIIENLRDTDLRFPSMQDIQI
ncbi:hypothetical protein O3G_MSEX005456 [Manduca sexta]|uniref:Sulfotransferase domain-containing protein n=2 Tax=Manduca sexta TaxID=7130 RepID=A0A921YZ29_MANSE|nr:hypothetical protein O3G_MSEX005456 [Manduca sexta]